MPLKRTPPPIMTSHNVLSVTSSPPRAGSEPNLRISEASDKIFFANENINTTSRFPKRKRQSESDFDSLRDDLENMMDSKISLILESINEIKTQNLSLLDSIEFVTKQYETVTSELKSLQEERRKDAVYIQKLEYKIENLERKQKSTALEIKNVPKIGLDSKEDLLKTVIKTGQVLNVPILPGDIRDIYRINTNSEVNRPIVVEMNSVLMRDKIIYNTKEYNKNKTDKLSTRTLDLSGEVKPIFISESLTLKTRKLFFTTRDFAKANSYDYCWVSHGTVYLRKSNGSRYVRIANEEDLKKLEV